RGGVAPRSQLRALASARAEPRRPRRAHRRHPQPARHVHDPAGPAVCVRPTRRRAPQLSHAVDPRSSHGPAGAGALTGDIPSLHDTYMIPPDRPYAFDQRVDARLSYRTQSILVVPLQDPAHNILGVLELLNTLDLGRVVPFDSQYESLVRSLASQAAVALRNARLEDLSFKDALTDVYNRRYFTIRIEEEFKRHSRFGEPLSLALMDLDSCE